MESFIAYSIGITNMSVCVKKDLSKEEIEKQANIANPTGITSQWKISKEKFKDDSNNPCPCDQKPNDRLHYLLVC